MKIDLAGPKQRGLAMGLNEFAGYLAVAIAAYVSALIAAQYGLRPLPFYLGIVFTISGLLLSLFLAKETSGHAQLEVEESGLGRSSLAFREVFLQASWKNKNLFSCSQAGLASNFNDGVSWGLFPLFFAAQGLSIDKIGFLAAVYPATWGITQLLTGTLSDRLGRKWMITIGMWLQGLAIVLVALVLEWQYRVGALFLLGIGTGMAYPTLLAGVGDAADPSWRTTAVGVYRFWRDLGYALGAILAGVIADRLGMRGAILVVGFLTVFSGLIVAFRMQEKRFPPLPWKGPPQ
jgi:MFS family permease